MEVKDDELCYATMGGNYDKGRATYDYLSLSKVGDLLFIVGWEDSAHHYWRSQYFTDYEEALTVYDDYRVNGIPDEYEDL